MAAGEQASVLGHSGPWEFSVFPRSPCLWPALSSTAQTQVGGEGQTGSCSNQNKPDPVFALSER